MQCCVFDVVSENLITFVVILLFLKIKNIAIQEKPTCLEEQAVCACATLWKYFTPLMATIHIKSLA